VPAADIVQLWCGTSFGFPDLKSVVPALHIDAGEGSMVRLALALIVLGFCLSGPGAATAAPIGTVAPLATQDPLAEPVHCRRWLPHRHSGAKPHGFGFGCSAKAKSTRTRRA